MERRIRIVCMLVGLVLVATTACAQTDPGQGQKTIIRVQGSLSMANMVDAWGKSFSEQQPDASVLVVGGGIKAGFKALGERTAEIAMSIRKAAEEEKAAAEQKGIHLQERCVGSEPFVLFVNPDAPVTELTIDQVRNIYNGQVSSWAEVRGPDLTVDPCSMLDQPRGPAGWFRGEVLESREFGSRVQFFKEPRYLVKAVSQGKGAIGYLGASLLNNILAREKELAVCVLKLAKDAAGPAALPSKETIDSGAYPLTTNVFFYWDGNVAPTSGVAAFVEFCARQGAR
jgi:phosphate transport system substrate-binding protein